MSTIALTLRVARAATGAGRAALFAGTLFATTAGVAA